MELPSEKIVVCGVCKSVCFSDWSRNISVKEVGVGFRKNNNNHSGTPIPQALISTSYRPIKPKLYTS